MAWVSARSLALLVLAAALLAVVHGAWLATGSVSDDAFILFRYARHFAQGEGLVWNAGEAPVEGFTSLLHVLVLALGLRLRIDPLLLSQVLGLAGSALSAIAAALLARELAGGRPRAGPAAALLVAASTSLAYWARSGLETNLFTGLLGLAMAAWTRERRTGVGRARSGALFFLAALSRPEAVGVAGLAFLFDLWAGSRGEGTPRSASSLGRAAFGWRVFGVLLAGFALWKLRYFHALLPNTFSAKSGGNILAYRSGLLQTWQFFKAFGPAAILLGLIPAAGAWRSPWRESLLLYSVVGLFIANVVRIGGDYQSHCRYLVPIVPVLAALAGAGYSRLVGSPHPERHDEAPGPDPSHASVPQGSDQPGDVHPSRSPSRAGRTPVHDAANASGSMRRRGVRLLSGALLALAIAGAARLSVKGRFVAGLLRPRPSHLETVDAYDSVFVRMGNAMDRIVPPGQTLASVAVGAIGWYCDRPILDMLGLNDPAIARRSVDLSRFAQWMPGHMKGDAAEVLRRKPDYVLLATREDETPHQPIPDWYLNAYPFATDLLASEEFRRLYHADTRQLPDGKWINFYRRVRE